METRRVVVTGIGLNSPLGNSYGALKTSLLAEKSPIEYIKEWDIINKLDTKVGGKVYGVDEKEIPRKYRRSMDRTSILSAFSTQDAIQDASLSQEILSNGNTGLSFGSTLGGYETSFKFMTEVKEAMSFNGQNSMAFLKVMSHTISANMAQMFHITGRNLPTCSACTSSSQAIGVGYESIKFGMSDVMLCGGAESLHFLAAGIFDILHATSAKFNDTPEKSSRPFDKHRDGVVVSEGSATLILEEYEHAKKRGAKIYGEVLAYATTCDGTHMTTPQRAGMQQCMQNALDLAQLSPEAIDYINAHATSTPRGDIEESHATFNLFGSKTPISSTKSYTGHLLGGCGSFESVISLMALNEGFAPPTLNLEEVDEECANLNYLTTTLEQENRIVMNNNFAFGGINTSLIFRKI